RIGRTSHLLHLYSIPDARLRLLDSEYTNPDRSATLSSRAHLPRSSGPWMRRGYGGQGLTDGRSRPPRSAFGVRRPTCCVVSRGGNADLGTGGAGEGQPGQRGAAWTRRERPRRGTTGEQVVRILQDRRLGFGVRRFAWCCVAETPILVRSAG